MEGNLKVESSEVPYGRTLFNDEAIEGYSFGQDDRGFEGPGFAPGSSAPSEPGSISTNQFPATPSYNSYDGYRGIDMTGNYANHQNRTKIEQMYGQQNQAGTNHNHEGVLGHGFHVGGIPIPPVISGTDLQAQIESQTAEHREQELFHNFKHQMMRKLRDVIFRGTLDKDDREMATKIFQKEQIDVDISEIDAKAGLYHTWKGLNDTVDTQYYNRDILTQLVDSFIQTIESQWAALSDEEKSYFGKTLVDLETEIENEMKRKNRKKRDGTLKKQVNGFMLFSREKKDELTFQNPNWSKGEIKKRVDRLWKEVDSETKNLYREKASQLGNGPEANQNHGLTSSSIIPNSNSNVMSSIEPIVFPPNVSNIPPPPLPEDETPIDITANDETDYQNGPKLVTLQCPVKNDPSLSITNDGEPAPKLQSI